MGPIGSKLGCGNSSTVIENISDDHTIISNSAITIEPATPPLTNHRKSIAPSINHQSQKDKLIVIWLDANVNDNDLVYQNAIKRLQRMTAAIHTFTNITECTQYLDTIKNEKILMVISNEFIRLIWSRIQNMSQIRSIYIICQNGDKQIPSDLDSEKIKGVFTRVEPIYNSVKRDNSSYEQDSLIMSIIPSMRYTKKDLPQLNKLFLYWMMVKVISTNANYERDVYKQLIKDLVEFARHQYSSDVSELETIDEFSKTYHQHTPVWWYTRNCFISSMLSRAFQTQDIEIIIRMAFFLKDLYLQLERGQNETLKLHKLPIVVYRSHNITDEDFEKIKDIQGNLLSFNNFLIADTNYENSYNLAHRAQESKTGVGIIFRMKIDTKNTSTPFISLQNVSYLPEHKNAFFFSMHSIFRIGDVKPIDDRVWQIDLTLTTHTDEQVRILNDLLREETQGASGWLKLPELMSIVRDYEQAKEIYYTILQLTPETDPLKMARVYNELGNTEEELGNYSSALAFYQKSIEIRRELLPPNHLGLTIAYNNIGEAQRQLGDYFNALSTHQKTLLIKKETLPPDDLSIALTYNNIALANESLGEFQSALEFHEKALAIKLKSLPHDHQDIALAYNNLGEIHRSMGHFQIALENLEKALQIRLKKYSSNDPALGIPYNNLGLIHRELGDYTKALHYLQKSLDVKLKTFPPDHPSLMFTYNNIGDVSHQLGQYQNALDSYQKALDIQLKAFSENHPEVATTYVNMGAAHQGLGEYSTALSYYQKAVKIRQKTLPSNHPALGTCYNNIGHAHQLMGDYNSALEYYQKTLKLQEKSLRQEHPSLAATYNNLADVQRKLGNLNKALGLYKKSLDIKKKNLPPQHPSLVVTYNNIGVIHQATKNHTAALETYKQTLEIQRKTLPPDHPDLAAVYSNMGVSHQSLKEYATALDYFKKALVIQEKTLPPMHPDTATTLNNIAVAYVYLGDYQSALENEQRAVEIGSKCLGADHPNVQIFNNYLERIQAKVDADKNKDTEADDDDNIIIVPNNNTDEP